MDRRFKKPDSREKQQLARHYKSIIDDLNSQSQQMQAHEDSQRLCNRSLRNKGQGSKVSATRSSA